MDKALVSGKRMIRIGDGELCSEVVLPETGSAGRLVVLAHGGPGGVKEGPADLYVDLADRLAERGIASVRFDFLGAGESTGAYEDMTITRQVAELGAVVDHVRSELRPSSLGIVGESYGATIAVLGLEQADYAALVLLWPAIWLLDNTFQSFVTPEKMEQARRHGFIEEEGEKVGLAFLNQLVEFDNVSAGLRGKPLPTLLVHGKADQEVPYQQSVRAAELLSGPKKVVLVPDGDHCLERPAERDVVYRETVDWLVTHV
ncbi:alpha/beta hydrolase family protein [Streptomyces sp. KMM 9044]|uniref:alpha/beta hydrolase family protein n=1 Tax=Streptomyces sp. KMM 9044 TaxID=2744474 RepID=UPI002151F5AA|nr:alpha/beta fold hydrolase [Streptomyces sp. KMM 9044]WAX78120.1 alpha/beta fold hydrolase [Streptomyces sp. KMM 9044]